MNRPAEVLLRRHLRKITRDPEFARLTRHPLTGESRTATSADGTVLHAEIFGAPHAPTVVLIPGWTERVAFFDGVTRSLVADGFRVVVYDLRGQGGSAFAARDDYAIARYGDDVEAVLEATCAGRSDVLIAGHSLGAMSIASWAASHDVAGRVAGVALMNTGLEGLVSASRILPPWLPARLADWISHDAFLGNPLPFPGLSNPVTIAAIRYIAFGPAATTGQIAFYETMLAACAPRVRAAAGISMSTMDLLHALPRIDVPVLVLAGANDRLTPPSHGERIAAEVPHLDDLIVMPRTGHMAPLERPAQLSQVLASFASRTLAMPAPVGLGVAAA